MTSKAEYLRDAARFCEKHGHFHMRWLGQFDDIGSWMQPQMIEDLHDMHLDVPLTTDEQVVLLCLAAAICDSEGA